MHKSVRQQQELEDQLVKLVSMMELHQQRKEQLAREQQQRQEEQFALLLEQQQQQRKLFMKQQCKAEEQMSALKDDLQQTKDAMRDGSRLLKHHWKECTEN